jgi:ribonuclease HII
VDISNLTIAEIKKIACTAGFLKEDFRHALLMDRRAGVREIYHRLQRLESIKVAEIKRLEKMYHHEKDLTAKGYQPVAGVDEAGRGPLAGPVYAAAVILPVGLKIVGLNDSKKLGAAKREVLAEQIKKSALAWAVGVSTTEEINRDNIHWASLTAMRRAVRKLKPKPAYVLVDGYRIDRLAIPQLPLVGGDGLSASIAAASILAKVSRDGIMDYYHRIYPPYGFDRHKGYATAEHLRALTAFGPCPLHRTGYRPVKDCLAGPGT